MSESSYQSGYGQSSYGSSSQGATPEMSAAAAEFRRNVQEASEKLSNAGQQLVSLSEALAKAIAEAQQAAERAEEAQRKAEAVQADMLRDYGAVADLVGDLQERIGALAILARPLPGEPRAEPPAQSDEAEGEPAGMVPDAEAFQPPVSSSPPPAPPSSGYGESGGQSWPSRNW
ncbi:MAG TPA: hypothetical protein VJB57_05790 [Dehalococcoidia bacterium]|nr:hypothetical protein [Dehalococcoidia bacterium]